MPLALVEGIITALLPPATVTPTPEADGKLHQSYLVLHRKQNLKGHPPRKP